MNKASYNIAHARAYIEMYNRIGQMQDKLQDVQDDERAKQSQGSTPVAPSAIEPGSLAGDDGCLDFDDLDVFWSTGQMGDSHV